MREREYNGRGHSDGEQALGASTVETDSEGFEIQAPLEIAPLNNVATDSAVITAQTAMKIIEDLKTRIIRTKLSPAEIQAIQAESVEEEGDWYGLSNDI